MHFLIAAGYFKCGVLPRRQRIFAKDEMTAQTFQKMKLARIRRAYELARR